MLFNGQIVTDNEEKANSLAKHYQATSSNEGYSDEFIQRKTKHDDHVIPVILNLPYPHKNLKYNRDFNMLELEQAIIRCKNGAPGDDSIHYEILRHLPMEAKKSLLNLYNQSWQSGSIPEDWSKAIVIPLLKPYKDKQSPASYRPISLTSTFTKLMQKMIKNRLCNHLEQNNLISNVQSGCRSDIHAKTIYSV